MIRAMISHRMIRDTIVHRIRESLHLYRYRNVCFFLLPTGFLL